MIICLFEGDRRGRPRGHLQGPRRGHQGQGRAAPGVHIFGFTYKEIT